jgi:hypothetical protein
MSGAATQPKIAGDIRALIDLIGDALEDVSRLNGCIDIVLL